MTTSGHPPKRLLQLLDAANFQLLCPHFATVEMVRKSALDRGGAALRYVYFPQQLVPIANISRREHDGTYPCRT